MEFDVKTLFMVAGFLATWGSMFYWCGRMKGRIDEMVRQFETHKEENTNTEKRFSETVKAMETQVSKIEDVQSEQNVLLGRIEERTKTLFDQTKELFTEMRDLMKKDDSKSRK